MIIIDNFLPQPRMAEIENLIQTRIQSTPQDALRGWTNLTWAQRLQNNSSLIWVSEISDFPEIVDDITTALNQNRILLHARPIGCQICAWYRGSCIPWHVDDHASFSATLHLRDWDVQHGGLFFWRDSDNRLQVAEPACNRCVIVDQKEQHMVSQVTYDAPGPRFTIQIWGCLPGDEDPKRRQDYLSYR